jgi:anaerobic selenocysteine-containing dehydrogenase
VALGIAHELVRTGRYDRDFVVNHTNVTHRELLAHLAPYTPEAVEKADCGVPADVVRRVAGEFASEGPSIAIAGAGCTDHVRGVQNQRCIDLLNVLAGYPDEDAWFAPVDPVPPSHPPERVPPLLDALAEPGTVKAYLSYMANPAFAKPDSGKWVEALGDEKRLPFLAVCDTHLTETALLADVFLPAASPFETWGVQAGFQTLSIRRPAAGFLGEMPALRETAARGRKFSEIRFLCKPLGESRGLADILIDLASRLGPDVSRFLDFSTIEDYLEKACEGVPVFGEGGYKKICENQYVPLPPPGDLRRDGFKTPSGRIEVRASVGETRELPSSGWKSKPLDLSTFVLLPYLPSTASPVSSNAKWLYEVIHINPLWIHTRTAGSLNLKDGDRVRLVSEAGSLETVVHVTAGIFPKAVAMARGFGHTGCGRIARAVPFESEDPDTALVWWSAEGAGVNPCLVVVAKTDPEGGGIAWMDTEVKMERCS